MLELLYTVYAIDHGRPLRCRPLDHQQLQTLLLCAYQIVWLFFRAAVKTIDTSDYLRY